MPSPVYSMAWPVAPATPISADDGENDVFCRHTEWQRTLDSDLHGARLELAQRLGRKHVLDLRCPYAGGERAERAVGGGVAVPADDHLARLRVSLLRPDHVDDTLVRAEPVVQRHPELAAVAFEIVQLLRGDRVGDRPAQLPCGRVVVHRGHCEVRSPHRTLCHPQTLERLRRGDLVDEMQVHVQQRRLTCFLAHNVSVPYLVEHRLGSHFCSSSLVLVLLDAENISDRTDEAGEYISAVERVGLGDCGRRAVCTVHVHCVAS